MLELAGVSHLRIYNCPRGSRVDESRNLERPIFKSQRLFFRHVILGGTDANLDARSVLLQLSRKDAY